MKMRIHCVIFAIGCANWSFVQAAERPDVAAYVKNAEFCEHFAGEWDSSLSKKRQREIERGVLRYCGEANLQLPILLKKYQNNPRVRKQIEAHAYDSVKSFKK